MTYELINSTLSFKYLEFFYRKERFINILFNNFFLDKEVRY